MSPDVRPSLRVLLRAVARRRGRRLDDHRVDAGHGWAGRRQRSGRANIYASARRRSSSTRCPTQRLYPFVAVGVGIMHTSSDILGSDTDWPLHIGGGVRWFATARSRCAPTFASCAARRVAGSVHAERELRRVHGRRVVGARVTSRPEAAAATAARRRRHRRRRHPRLASTSARTSPRTRTASRTRTAAPIPTTTATASPTRRTSARTTPEDKDGFQDDDGCPDNDNDGDGIPDAQDKCPNEPEDKDGFQDDDGCPDPDNDGDGIPDAHDKCPNEPETINGFEDDDGCPDKGDALVILSARSPRDARRDPVQAARRSRRRATTCSARSARRCARTPRSCALRITVHVQPTENPDDDQELSREARAGDPRLARPVRHRRQAPRGRAASAAPSRSSRPTRGRGHDQRARRADHPGT